MTTAALLLEAPIAEDPEANEVADNRRRIHGLLQVANRAKPGTPRPSSSFPSGASLLGFGTGEDMYLRGRASALVLEMTVTPTR
ncbi:hypothetical protein CVT26_007437 [Gymnopilus dilepis]|uniref:Uncharacterized protein n=1 Tax=Gymnopilus dilepis TaxID=231916 RepID=A0A409WIS3_9AGAR|nr:hypothetical protein CVT26_007437 [Gymnopilus dilepis]